MAQLMRIENVSTKNLGTREVRREKIQLYKEGVTPYRRQYMAACLPGASAAPRRARSEAAE